MKYRDAYALVHDLAEQWRKKEFPYHQAAHMPCPACGGNLHLVQTTNGTTANVIYARCWTPFCVSYSE